MCFCRALWVQRVRMASEDGLMSPESSVTSLLATSGLLQSSLRPERVPSIKYRDRHYISASEALDAYITDFQRSLRDAETTTGKLELPKERTKPHPRNRDGKSAHWMQIKEETFSVVCTCCGFYLALLWYSLLSL